ncbi:MAG: cytidylate kinase-like family protein [Prevotella sp.]|uniref:cytidylate kinase-like family protein n=1 Tax=Prevotella sp. TaxID=59823 RepID=UPI002A2A26D4|nr:cytidylate kinase-like family protein [Prevotella sp.]MDD7317590.1 cytidylate kinase-like family protein [Prevotellaceae bacterium]MDY4020563.1 cytidylate kinase-like family protein [Prevotella sp.]
MDKEKIIINVGRQLGSGGHEVAKRLADRMGCRFYDKELLNLAAKESGFSEKIFEKNDEHKGFLRSLFCMHAPHIGDNSFYNSNLSQESLFMFQSNAIKKAAAEGACVFVGRCADYVLREYDNVLNVFITADIKQRIERVKKRDLCDDETACKIINSQENERASYYNYYTGQKWGNAANYHLCINSSVLGIEGTASFIMDFIKLL